MREKIFNTIGFLLLGICFAVSLVRILTLPGENRKDDRITLRLAHWQLEGGVRKTFDAIAAEYMKLHPNVKVEQLPIPESIYTNWLVTQLVGETAPDLIEMGRGQTDERTARFFFPLTDIATRPNPYNKGTDLEHMPLRNTLFDGMEGGYVPALLEYYSVPISGSSVRMYYNLELLKEISGSATPPTTYDELMLLCQKAHAYARSQGIPLVAIAGSKYNSLPIMQRLFSSQTQKMVEQLNPAGVFGEDPVRRIDDYFQGRWSLDSEAVRSGFRLMHEVGQFMQPGFIQLQRDDAMLSFVQKRALMICTGSWDATSLQQQTSFPIVVAPIPFPSPKDPVYGPYTHGALSEAGAESGVGFGVAQCSRNPEVAKDFLCFLASRKMNQLWTDQSGWIPAIVGVKASPQVTPFLPVSSGYMPGILPYIGGESGLSDLYRLYSTNLHRLVGAKGDLESFLTTLKAGYRDALASDLRRILRTTADISQRGDTQFAGLSWLACSEPDNEAASDRLDAFMQAATTNDRKFYRIRLSLQKAGFPTP